MFVLPLQTFVFGVFQKGSARAVSTCRHVLMVGVEKVEAFPAVVVLVDSFLILVSRPEIASSQVPVEAGSLSWCATTVFMRAHSITFMKVRPLVVQPVSCLSNEYGFATGVDFAGSLNLQVFAKILLFRLLLFRCLRRLLLLFGSFS